MPALQLKVMAALAALILFVGIVSGVLAERGLRERETARISRSLEERAALVDELAGGAAFETGSRAQLDALADRAARAADARVTLIAPDGTVVGDSDVPLERLDSVENHSDRPEVRAALDGSVGEISRRSGTVGRRLYYLALPASHGGVVRLAVDLSALDKDVRDLRMELVAAGLLGLVAALVLSFVLSWLTLRPIKEMRTVAESIARGDLEPRMPMRVSDELGEISNAINFMAERLRSQLDETTGEKERLQAVLNAMAEGVLVVDAAGEILLANNRQREFFDMWGDLSGRSPLAMVRNEDFEQLLTDADHTDEAVSCEIEGPGGRTLRVQAARFPSGDGPRVGTVAVFHDVTEIRRLEQVRQDFVANASHELRTPLSAVQGFAETLLNKPELAEPDRASYLGIIERHALRLGRIVDDLLDLSAAESEQVPLDFSLVDVAAVASALVSDARSRTAGQRLTIELTVPGASTAWAERRAVEQILSNLLENAVKYTEAGGRIDVRIEVVGSRLVTSLQDTGIGIPEEDLSRIFERFYRVDRARSRALGGTGLGLSIVKHLVQRMGGEISLESEPGRGSTFTFTLAREKPAPRDRP